MKIGRNDSCPCGSGKKYKHCCLQKSKVISFPEPADPPPKTPSGDSAIGVHRLMGFDSAEEYNRAIEAYQFYCENEIPAGESIPSFRQFLEGESALASVFENIDMSGILEGADSIEEANRRMAEAVEEYNQTIERDEKPLEAFEDLFTHGLSRKNRAVSLNRSIPTDMIESTPIISLLRGYLEYIVRNGGSITLSDDPVSTEEFEKVLTVLKEYSSFNFTLKDSSGRPVIFQIILILRYLCLSLGYTLEERTHEKISEKGIRVLEGKYLKNCYFAALKEYEFEFNWFYHCELPESIEVLQDFAAVATFLIARTRNEKNQYSADPAEVFDIINNLISIENLFTGKDYLRKDQLIGIFTDYIFILFAHLFGFLDIAENDTKSPKAYTYRTTTLFNQLLQWSI